MPRIFGAFFVTITVRTSRDLSLKQHNNYNERRIKTRMWNCTFTIKETARILQRKIRLSFLRHTKNVPANGKAT